MPSRISPDDMFQGIPDPEETRPISAHVSQGTDVEELSAGVTSAEQGEGGSPFALAVARPDGAIGYLPLSDGENLVGRGEMASVTIESPDVSRRHALIMVDGSEVTICDVGSSNHTYVEGIRLERDVPAAIGHGTRLKLGGVRARLMNWVGRREG